MLSFPDFKAKSIVVVNAIEKEKMAIKNDNFIVKDADDKIVLQLSCHKIFSLWIIGNYSLTSVLLKKSKKHGFSIVLLTSTYRNLGVWNAGTEGNFLLRYKQYHNSNFHIAKRLVFNKIDNQRNVLKSVRSKTLMEKDAIHLLRFQLEKVEIADNFKTLLGIEGVASKIYFSTYFKDNDWQGRKPRSKQDITNLLMDMGYSYLFYFVENMLLLYGFDIYKGVYHQNFYQRKSLVCDLVEPFRPIIDKRIKKAYSLNQIHEKDFKLIRSQYFLDFKKSKPYTKWLVESILEYKEDIFLYCREYYRAFMKEKSIEEYPEFIIN